MIACIDRLDALYWAQLAHEEGVRLPHHDQELTTGRARRWLRKIGVSVPDYLSWCASRTLGAHVAHQRVTWDYRSWAGLALENRSIMAHYRDE